MNNFFNKLQPYAPLVLRLGLAFVLVWFGTNELIKPMGWTALIPHWIVNGVGISALTFVYVNGTVEIILALLLVLNIWTRWVGLLIFLHLASIVFDLGLNAVGVRDIGLSIAALTISLWGSGHDQSEDTVSSQA